MIILFLLPVMALQLWLCFRVKNRFFRFLPLGLGLVSALGGWGTLLACKLMAVDPGLDAVVFCVLAMLLGIALLMAVGLCWLIYGIMKLAERSKHL